MLRRGFGGLFDRRLKIALGAAIVIGVVLMAILAPLIAPHDPYKQNLIYRLQPPVWSHLGDWCTRWVPTTTVATCCRA